jgi:hydrogenase expression/formation protein HypE
MTKSSGTSSLGASLRRGAAGPPGEAGRSKAAPADPVVGGRRPSGRVAGTEPRTPRSWRRPLDLRHGRVELSHGAGGRAMAQLIADIFHEALDNEWLRRGNDQAAFDVEGGRLVMTTDGYVISPLFFPGGDIGSLSVNGTVNDIAMAGARPRYLSASFILEEGFPLADLKRVADSMGAAARASGVAVVTGDTKVVERGKADGVFISTTGIGVVPAGVEVSVERAAAGDRLILSGPVGDHGVAVMSRRHGLDFETDIVSDSAPLHDLVAAMVAAGGQDLHAMRDPTRGGLAATLNEIAQQAGVGIRLQESVIPVRPAVAAACELLGLDPLYVANEGKLIAFVAPRSAPAVLAAMRAHPLGGDAAIIGEAVADEHRFVQMRTAFGGERIVDWLAGEQLPRIC